jgi:hypothetical protein
LAYGFWVLLPETIDKLGQQILRKHAANRRLIVPSVIATDWVDA